MNQIILNTTLWTINNMVFAHYELKNPLVYLSIFQLMVLGLICGKILKNQQNMNLLHISSMVQVLTLAIPQVSTIQTIIGFIIFGHSYQQLLMLRLPLLICIIFILNANIHFRISSWSLQNVACAESFCFFLIIWEIFILNQKLRPLEERLPLKSVDKVIMKKFDTENLLENRVCSSFNISRKRVFSQRTFKTKKQSITLFATGEPTKKKSIFNVLINSITEGVIVIQGIDKPEFANKYLKSLFPNLTNSQILDTLFTATNCKADLEEQKLISSIYNKLHLRFSNSEQYDENNDEEYQLNDNIAESIHQTVRQECEVSIRQLKQYLISNKEFDNESDGSSLSGKSRNYCFISQSTMLCSLTKKNLQENSQRDSSHNSTMPQSFKNLYLHISFKPYIKGHRTYIMLIIRDVSQFNQIEVLRTVNQNKSKILYQVSHEFRTPLNCIILMIQSLLEISNKDLCEKYLCPILSSANQLLCLANDLLDVAQLKAGKFQLNIQQIDVYKLLVDIHKLMDIQSRSRGLELKIDSPPQLMIYSDFNRIRQILLNLIGNAIKFTTQGSITIKAQHLKDKMVEFQVTDTGVGIDQKSQKQLFTEFGKLKSETNMNAQGVGLGLVISNIIARKLSEDPNNDGVSHSIKTYSEGRGSGTTFSFVIFSHEDVPIKTNRAQIQHKRQVVFEVPQKIDEESFGSIEQFLQSGRSGCKCKQILIVDDSQFNLMAIQHHLKLYHPKIDVAFNGEEALEKVRNYRQGRECGCVNYKIILMDIEMPILDGIEATRMIRQLGVSGTKIYACSGHSSKQDIERWHEAGMNGHFTKPLVAGLIVDLIKKTL